MQTTSTPSDPTHPTMRSLKHTGLISLILAANLAGAAPTRPQAGSGVPADMAQDRPKVTKEMRFSAWGLSCAVAQNDRGSAEERCMISQVIATDPQRKKVVLGITVDYLDSPKTPTVHFRFAAGANTKAGIGLKIDDRPEMRLVINNCNEQRCESVGRLSPDVLKVWRKGKNAQFAFLAKNGEQVILPVSLAGFDAALAALDKQLKETR